MLERKRRVVCMRDVSAGRPKKEVDLLTEDLTLICNQRLHVAAYRATAFRLLSCDPQVPCILSGRFVQRNKLGAYSSCIPRLLFFGWSSQVPAAACG